MTIGVVAGTDVSVDEGTTTRFFDSDSLDDDRLPLPLLLCGRFLLLETDSQVNTRHLD